MLVLVSSQVGAGWDGGIADCGKGGVREGTEGCERGGDPWRGVSGLGGWR